MLGAVLEAAMQVAFATVLDAAETKSLRQRSGPDDTSQTAVQIVLLSVWRNKIT